jgi:hypothetical protein
MAATVLELPFQHILWHTLQYNFWHQFGMEQEVVMTVETELSERSLAQIEKVRENRLRRMADRQGLRLLKSRVRDPRSIDFGIYWLTDVQVGGLVLGRTPGDYHYAAADLDDIEHYLTQDVPLDVHA